MSNQEPRIVTTNYPKASAEEAAENGGGTAKRTQDGWLVTFQNGMQPILYVKR